MSLLAGSIAGRVCVELAGSMADSVYVELVTPGRAMCEWGERDHEEIKKK